MPYSYRDSVKIYWEEQGDPDGTPIILLHGLFMTERIWDRIVKYIPQYRVITLDLHGHGRSSRPVDETMYSWDEMNADVLAVMDDLQIPRAIVGGLSLGANVSLTFAQSYPERVLGLILEMPVLSESEEFARFLFTSLRNILKISRPVVAPITNTINKIPRIPIFPELALLHDILGINPDAAQALINGFMPGHFPPDTPSDLKPITAPALVIGHHVDALHAWDDAKILAKNLSNAELAEMYTSLDLRIHPKEYAEMIITFMQKHGF